MDGGIRKTRSTGTARPYPDLIFFHLFLLVFLFQVLYNPHHSSMVLWALLQAPYIHSVVGPLKGPYTMGKSGAVVRQSVQRIFKIIFSNLGNKPIPNRDGQNCFHYSIIDTSKHILSVNAMIIGAILHAQNLRTRESCMHVLKMKI